MSKSSSLEILRTGGNFIFTALDRVRELAEDPQVRANDYAVDFEHPRFGKTQMLRITVRLSETPIGKPSQARPREL